MILTVGLKADLLKYKKALAEGMGVDMHHKCVAEFERFCNQLYERGWNEGKREAERAARRGFIRL